MPSGLKRASGKAERILLTATIAIAGAIAGCDNAQNDADKHVRQQLNEARQFAAAGKADEARQKHEEAAKDSSASGSLRASAKSAVGQDQLALAEELITKIDRSELNGVRLVSEISALTEQIRTGGTVAAGYKQLDPKPTLDKIAADIAAAEGGADKPVWFTSSGGSIPTLSAVKQQLAQLETQINTKQELVAGLTQQRQRVLDDAEKAAADADSLKGDASVTAFKKASELRKQAGDLAVQIDRAQTDINHLKASVATAQAQQAAVTETINQLKDQAATIDAAWKQMDSRAAAQRQLAGKIVGDSAASGAGNPSATITQKAAELARNGDEIKKMRVEAAAALNSASALFDDARKAAAEFLVDLKNQIRDPKNDGRPELAAWKVEDQVMDPAQYRLQQALALRKLGSLQASAAASLRSRLALAQSIDSAMKANDIRANVAVVDAGAERERLASIAAADAAFKESSDILTDVTEGSSPEPVKDRARIARALTYYAWAQLDRQASDDPTKDPAKKKIADRIKLAIADRDLVAEHNTVLPSMPPELGSPPKPAAAPSEPGTPPATEPGAAPAATSPSDTPAVAPGSAAAAATPAAQTTPPAPQ